MIDEDSLAEQGGTIIQTKDTDFPPLPENVSKTVNDLALFYYAYLEADSPEYGKTAKYKVWACKKYSPVAWESVPYLSETQSDESVADTIYWYLLPEEQRKNIVPEQVFAWMGNVRREFGDGPGKLGLITTEPVRGFSGVGVAFRDPHDYKEETIIDKKSHDFFTGAYQFLQRLTDSQRRELMLRQILTTPQGKTNLPQNT